MVIKIVRLSLLFHNMSRCYEIFEGFICIQSLLPSADYAVVNEKEFTGVHAYGKKSRAQKMKTDKFSHYFAVIKVLLGRSTESLIPSPLTHESFSTLYTILIISVPGREGFGKHCGKRRKW